MAIHFVPLYSVLWTELFNAMQYASAAVADLVPDPNVCKEDQGMSRV